MDPFKELTIAELAPEEISEAAAPTTLASALQESEQKSKNTKGERPHTCSAAMRLQIG